MISNTSTRWMLTIASGLALALAFPKFDLDLLAWVAFVPLLYAIVDLPFAQVFFYAWLQALVCYVASTYWVMITLHNFAGASLPVAFLPMLLLAAVLAIYTGAAFLAAEFVTRRWFIPRVITVPIAWTALEWLRSFFPIGFPWDSLGYSAYRDLPLIQFAEFTGVYGISALIMLFNVVVFGVVASEPSRRVRVWGLSVLTCVMGAALVFGTIRVHQMDERAPAGQLRIGMIQGNIPQSIKWDPRFLPSSFKVYLDESAAAARQHADLIVWPEAAAAFLFQPGDQYPPQLAMHQAYRSRLLELARTTGAPILFGAPAYRLDDGKIGSYNRAYLVSGAGQVQAFYDKMQLVPFGEYVPMRALLGFFVDKIVEGFGDLAPGAVQTLFEVRNAKLGILICYESIFPDLTRRAVDNGANLLVNITNDAWYGLSSAPYQLLAMAAMRSVESHVTMVRVANTGISAVISPAGRIMDRTELFVRRTVVVPVDWYQGRTLYDVVGDLFSEICFALIAIGVVGGFLFPRKRTPLEEFTAGLIGPNGPIT